jgi:hypothetical protein
VTAANYYAAEDEKARMAGTYITFNATRCAKDCLGWNTNSRRCDCYAHPVAWVVAKDHTFEKPHVYAEAQ